MYHQSSYNDVRRCAFRRSHCRVQSGTSLLGSSRFIFWIARSLAALAFIAVLPLQCAAAADPAGFVANVGAQGISALGPDIPIAERIARLRRLFRDDFDIPGIGLFAMGRYRLSATPQEQQEFFRVYPKFTVRALANRLDDYGGAVFRVIGTRSVGNETVVNSQVMRANGTAVQFDWYLTDSGGQYRIADVVVGGLSMKLALRDQFASWIENNGRRFGALLSVLRQQVARAY
jgi:phospholipid transport system substrate-binding protein